MTASPPSSQLDTVRQRTLAMPMAQTLALSFEELAPGEVTLSAPVQDGWCFAPGQLQATAMFALADFAAVAAAATLLPTGWANSTVDASIKFIAPARGKRRPFSNSIARPVFIAPARGKRLRANGRVVQAGKSLTVCAADVYAIDGAHETLCATLLGTARNFAVR